MKKLVLTIAIVLGMTLGASAQYYDEDGKPQKGGLFGRGADLGLFKGQNDTPLLPLIDEENDEDEDAPLGSGAVLLIGMGAAYALAKKSRKE